MANSHNSLTLSSYLLAGQILRKRGNGGDKPPPVVPQITAVVPPAAQPLFDGLPVGGIPNIATYRNTANYSSNVGTISTVDVLVDGAAQDDSWVLSEGEAVAIRVTDSQANTQDWTIDESVDYSARLTDNGDGTWSLETNGLAPSDLVVPTLTATVDGTDYTYSGHTIAELTGGPTFADGYPTLSHDGAGAEPVAGDTATVDPGYLVYAGTLTGPGYQWRRDGADISAATSAGYTVQAADEGTAITCAVTAADSNASRTEETAALGVPSTATATDTAPSFVGTDVKLSGGSDITLSYPAVQAGDLAVIALLNRLGSMPTITGFTQVGATAQTGSQSSDARMSIFTRRLDGSETTQGVSGGNRLAAALYVYRPSGAGSLTATIIGSNAGTGGPISIPGGALNSSAGRVLVAIGDRGNLVDNIGSIANAALSGLGNKVEAAHPTSPHAGSIECVEGTHAGGTLSATSASQAAAERWAAINVEIWEA